MLRFDEATTRLLEDAYQGADISARRRVSFDALAPARGETILDLGCGNGLMTLEMSRAVGDSGRVIGVDPAAPMLAAARARCGERANVDLVEGKAGALPVADASLDAAVSVQVFEYLPDVPGALADLRRAMRPGGRLVIGDIDFGTLAWHSDDPDRMARLLRAYENHLADPHMPRRLPALLRAAGFLVQRVIPAPFLDTSLRPGGLAEMTLHLIPGYLVDNGLIDPAEAEAWADEQRQLAREGRFFYALTHFVFLATRA